MRTITLFALDAASSLAMSAAAAGLLCVAHTATPAHGQSSTAGSTPHVAPAQLPAFALPGSAQRGSAQLGLQLDDGDWVGMGPAYKARFDRSGMTFTPALGEAVRENMPLQIDCLGYSRGQLQRDASANASATEVKGLRLRRVIATGVTERFDIRRDGVELSYDFAERPGGDGDLVVQLRLRTALPLRSADVSDGLRFGHHELGGGVTLGGVLGIDAAGRSVAGRVVLLPGGSLSDREEHRVELRLPADFVDEAQYPLTLDPLIGPEISVATSSNERAPDVAYDASFDVYAVTWWRRFSLSDSDVLLQRFRGDGTPVGALIGLEVGAAAAGEEPRVANVATEDAFVTVWQVRAPAGVFARALDADPASNRQSARIELGDPADVLGQPDIGGESLFDNEALAVWNNLSAGSIEAVQASVVNSPTALTLTSFGQVDISSGFNDSWPVIAKSGGRLGRYGVAWERSVSGVRSIHAKVVNRNLLTLAAAVQISSGSTARDQPDIDGDGERWTATYFVRGLPTGNGVGIGYRALELRSGSLGFGSSEIVIPATETGGPPHIMCLGDSQLLSYPLPDNDLIVRSLDPFDCSDCEPVTRVETSVNLGWRGRMAARFSGNPDLRDGVGLITWEDFTSGVGGAIRARRWQAADGLLDDLGGGCGAGGTARAACARVGTQFEHRLTGARASVATALVFSADRIDAPCGGCALVPDPFVGLAIPGGITSAAGDAAVSMPIPNVSALAGLTFFDQWLTADNVGSGACAPLGADLSNALRVTIQ